MLDDILDIFELNDDASALNDISNLSEIADILDMNDLSDIAECSNMYDISNADSCDPFDTGFATNEGAYNVSFEGKDTLPPDANSDGYISKGNITLEATISDTETTFKKYNKGGSDYVLYNGNYIKLTGNTVTIGGIRYDVP